MKQRLEPPVLRIVTAAKKLAFSHRFPSGKECTKIVLMRSFLMAVLQLRNCRIEAKNNVKMAAVTLDLCSIQTEEKKCCPTVNIRSRRLALCLKCKETQTCCLKPA